jgi:crotonobetainyl-CoA:carnitine CoA-transferase CaiB-like acyl-CoA transferase
MTRDRVLVNVTCQQDSEWRSLCNQLDRRELADEPRFATFELRRAARADVEAELAALIGRLDAAELERRLDDGGIAHGRVRSVDEVARHPQLEALGLLQDRGFGTLVGPVLTGARAERPPPALGEHNLEILSAAGCSAAEVRTLAADGILIPANRS